MAVSFGSSDNSAASPRIDVQSRKSRKDAERHFNSVRGDRGVEKVVELGSKEGNRSSRRHGDHQSSRGEQRKAQMSAGQAFTSSPSIAPTIVEDDHLTDTHYSLPPFRERIDSALPPGGLSSRISVRP